MIQNPWRQWCDRCYIAVQRYGISQTGMILTRRMRDLVVNTCERHAFCHQALNISPETVRQHASAVREKFKTVPIVYDVSDSERAAIIEASDRFMMIKDPPWHSDILLDPKISHFNSSQFCKDIALAVSHSPDERSPDIRIAWEASRLQGLPVLGCAFVLTGFASYAYYLVDTLNQWIIQNPFMTGCDWMSPMEVAIRAINIIWALHFIHKYIPRGGDLWRNIVVSLYEHMAYLERNLEWYDGRTNNHLISDLVGYLYLCWYFGEFPGAEGKMVWAVTLLVAEFERQFFYEGSSYEGSTAYHRFVTQLLYHAIFICDEIGIPMGDFWYYELDRMLAFTGWLTPQGGNLILIGDNDSSTVLSPLLNFVPQRLSVPDNYGIKDFPAFGISVLKTEAVHFTLRHHAYLAVQPSGHFHNDAASITLALGGQALLIDPGTYVYTGSAYWRNFFRSATVHNSFFIRGHEPVPFTSLFGLDLPEREHHTHGFTTEHDLYARFGARAHREISMREHNIKISDYWSGTTHHDTEWNFTCAPEVRISRVGQNIRLETDSVSVDIISDHHWSIADAWHAPHYGVKMKTYALRARKVIGPHHRENTTLRLEQPLLNIHNFRADMKLS